MFNFNKPMRLPHLRRIDTKHQKLYPDLSVDNMLYVANKNFLFIKPCTDDTSLSQHIKHAYIYHVLFVYLY